MSISCEFVKRVKIGFAAGQIGLHSKEPTAKRPKRSIGFSY